MKSDISGSPDRIFGTRPVFRQFAFVDIAVPRM